VLSVNPVMSVYDAVCDDNMLWLASGFVIIHCRGVSHYSLFVTSVKVRRKNARNGLGIKEQKCKETKEQLKGWVTREVAYVYRYTIVDTQSLI